MKRIIMTILSVLIPLLFVGCRTILVPAEDGLTRQQYFQLGAEAIDHVNYEQALLYYEKAKASFPDDIYTQLWSSYEIAFIHYRMGRYLLSVQLFDQLIAVYNAEDSSSYPQGPLILAQKVRDKVLQKMKPRERDEYYKQREAPAAEPTEPSAPADSTDKTAPQDKPQK